MTAAELQTRTLARLDEDGAGTYYTAGEALNALNEGQRVFVLLTLCLETTGNLALLANQSTYRLLTSFTDYLLPLRIRVSGAGGTKLDPGRLEEFDAANLDWQAEPGTPSDYCHLGFDFLAIRPRPAAGGSALDVTYARCPTRMNAGSATPEIAEEYHPALIDYAISRLRAKEGGAEFLGSLKYFERFLQAANKLGTYVRARNKAQLYDRGPFELSSFDLSKLTPLAPRPARRKQNG